MQVPPTGRFGNLRTPAKGTLVSVRGILSGITASETVSIDMESVTFLSPSNANRSNTSAPPVASGSNSLSTTPNTSSVGRTKRERRLEKENNPAKRIRIGPPEVFVNSPAVDEPSGEATAEKPSELTTSQTISKGMAK